MSKNVMQFEWSKAIETGHNNVDEQHVKLFTFLKELKEASGKFNNNLIVNHIIGQLKQYALEHFAYEEELMETFEYDEINRHKLIHKEFVKKVCKIEEDVQFTNQYENLVDFIYDWLISHINSIDKIMIAKMNGTYETIYASDSIAAQTRSVVNNAYNVAGQVEKISIKISDIKTNNQKNRLLDDLSNASERLINLVSLSQQRVERFCCNDYDLNHIIGIQNAIITSVTSLLNLSVKNLINYGNKILKEDNKFFPYGAGTTMTVKVSKINILLQVAGGIKQLNDDLRELIMEALDITNEVIVKETNLISLENFKNTGCIGSDHDNFYINLALKSSKQISLLLEQCIINEDISMNDLFDERYVPVKNTNPQQYTTKFLTLLEQILPKIQEEFINNDEIHYAVAIDRNGYIPVHNKKYSYQQKENDINWNKAHSRNKSMFNDKVGLTIAKNKNKILLLNYMRDLGDELVLMRDVSSPIIINGKHWGAFRIGYTIT